MVEKRKEEVKQLLQRSEKLSLQLDNLHTEMTLTVMALTEEVGRINDAKIRLISAKQKMLKLLSGI